ncbi:MAG: hypothetical protein KGI58_03670 [Patescibacteria group bacterium]|nr:hypothetical protein [Patescibacteria group bacterium]
MIHQFHDKKRIAKRKNIIRNIIVIGILFIISISGVLAWSGKLFNIIGLPIWKAQNNVLSTANNESYLLRSKSSLFNENEMLKKDNIDLKNQMIDYQIIKNENDKLKELLGRIPPKENLILATILAKPNRSPYDTLIIDIGSDSGMTNNLQVFGDGNVPIGEISKVYPNTSLVTLYSNPGKITPGVLDGSNTSVELIGRGGGNFDMMIPIDVPSENGKLVVIPNLKTDIIAIVDGVISAPTDPMKKVLLHSPVNVQGLKWVEVKRN